MNVFSSSSNKECIVQLSSSSLFGFKYNDVDEYRYIPEYVTVNSPTHYLPISEVERISGLTKSRIRHCPGAGIKKMNGTLYLSVSNVERFLKKMAQNQFMYVIIIIYLTIK